MRARPDTSGAGPSSRTLAEARKTPTQLFQGAGWDSPPEASSARCWSADLLCPLRAQAAARSARHLRFALPRLTQRALPQVCPLCGAFASDSSEALAKHEAGCFLEASRAAETAFQRHLVQRALPFLQSVSWLLVLTSSATLASALLRRPGVRDTRRCFSLVARSQLVPVESPSWPSEVLLPSALPPGLAGPLDRLFLPLIALVALPAQAGLLAFTFQPRRHACIVPAYLLAGLVNMAQTGAQQVLVWRLARRVVLQPRVMLVFQCFVGLVDHYLACVPLKWYLLVNTLRGAFLAAPLLLVTRRPGWLKLMWPTLLHLAVHLACVAHAPRQFRLMRARWVERQGAEKGCRRAL